MRQAGAVGLVAFGVTLGLTGASVAFYLGRPASTCTAEEAGTESTQLLRIREPCGQWGYANAKGRVAVSLRFHAAREFSEGLAAVQVDDPKGELNSRTGEVRRLFGFINEKGEFAIEPAFETADSFRSNLRPGVMPMFDAVQLAVYPRFPLDG